VQDLIVLGHGDAENDRRYVFEAVDPFLSFRPLTSHIEQSVTQLQITKSEPREKGGDWQLHTARAATLRDRLHSRMPSYGATGPTACHLNDLPNSSHHNIRYGFSYFEENSTTTNYYKRTPT
jgi:hypothetical protein